jgi:hypothetical protein
LSLTRVTVVVWLQWTIGVRLLAQIGSATRQPAHSAWTRSPRRVTLWASPIDHAHPPALLLPGAPRHVAGIRRALA